MAGYRIPGTTGIAGTFESTGAEAEFRGPSAPRGTLSAAAHALGHEPSWLVQESLDKFLADTARFADAHLPHSALRSGFLGEVRISADALRNAVRHRRFSAQRGEQLLRAMQKVIAGMTALASTRRGADFNELLTALSQSSDTVVKNLLNPAFPKRTDEEKLQAGRDILRMLRFPPSQTAHLMARDRVDRWLWMLSGALTWIVTCGQIPNLMPWRPVVRAHLARAPAARETAPPPAPAPRPRRSEPAPAPAPKPDTLAHVDQNSQAQTLEAAAESGVPFCEECERARQQAQASG